MQNPNQFNGGRAADLAVSTSNAEILIRLHSGENYSVHYTIDSSSKAFAKFEAEKGSRQWTRPEIEEWIQTNFPAW